MEHIKTNFHQFKCIKALALLGLWLLLPSLGLGKIPKYDPNNVEDAVIVSETKIVPAAIKKSKEERIIDFTMQDPAREGETIHAQFQYDANENKSIAVIRDQMKWQHDELKRQIEFTRVFLKLPTDMSLEEVFRHYVYLPQHIRDEIHRQYGLKRKSVGQIFKGSFMRPMNTSLHGWGAQSILFAAAIGNIMYLQLLTDYAANPLSMEQHLQSLTDPIAHMAFYAFMVANGFTTDLITKYHGGVAGKKASTIRLAVPYLGMSAGMLASNITAEALNLLKVCANDLLNRRSEEEKQIAKLFGQIDPCDAAQDEFFNFNNKVEQYIPMMLSMMTATGTLTLGQISYYKGKQVFQTKGAQRLAGKKVFEAAKKFTKPTLKFIGLRLAASVTPAGWVFNGITIGAALGSMAQNTGFIGLDHAVNPFFAKLWAQFWRAGDVDNIDEKLKSAYIFNQNILWDNSKTKLNHIRYKGKNYGEDHDILPLLKTFQEQMDAWRLVNHQKFFTGIQLWTEISSQLVRELQASESFYGAFVGEVFNSFKSYQIRKTEGEITDARLNIATHLPFRKFPLYKVKPTGHASCEVDPENCITEPELYWFHPDDMTTYQINTVKEIIEKFEALVPEFHKKKNLKSESLKAIQNLTEKLKSKKDYEIGLALTELNKIITNKSLKDNNALELLVILRNNLGDPYPIMVEGMGLPYIYMSLFSQHFSGLPDIKKNGYVFRTYPEYLFYQMICGPDFKESKSILSRALGFRPKYVAPSIVTQSHVEVELPEPYLKKYNSHTTTDMTTARFPKRFLLCEPLVKYEIPYEVPFEILYQAKFYEPGRQQGLSLTRFLGSKIQPEIIGNWTDTSAESNSNVDKWWSDNIKPVFADLFTQLDNEFQSLLIEMIEGLQSEKLVFGADTDGSFKRTKAGRGLLKSSNQELHVYLTLLAEMEMLSDQEQYSKVKIKISDRMTFLEQMNLAPMARVPSQNELIESMQPLYKALKGLKIENKRAVLPITPEELKDLQNNIGKAIISYGEHIKTLKLNPYQTEIAQMSLQGTQKVLSSLSGYLLYTQLTNFSAKSAYDNVLSGSKHVEDNKQNTKATPTRASPFGR